MCVCVCVLRSHCGMCVCVFVLRSHWDVCVSVCLCLCAEVALQYVSVCVCVLRSHCSVCVCVCTLRSHWDVCVSVYACLYAEVALGYVSVCVFVLRSHWDVCVMDLILIQTRPKGPTGSAPLGHAASSGQQRLPGLTFPGPQSHPKCRTTVPASSREDRFQDFSGEDARMRANSCQGPQGRVMTRSRRGDSGPAGTQGG